MSLFIWPALDVNGYMEMFITKRRLWRTIIAVTSDMGYYLATNDALAH